LLLLEVLEIGAGLEPLGGVVGDLTSPKKCGDGGWDVSAVFQEPVLLKDPSRSLRRPERVLSPLRVRMEALKKSGSPRVFMDGCWELSAADIEG
jgi:hypothetical protein